MTDNVNLDYGAFRHVDLTRRWRGATASRKQTSKMEQYESYVQTALQTPMYRNLPTSGFKYDWEQLRVNDGLFVFCTRGTNYSNYTVNSRVQDLSPSEMDTFCAEVFNKATVLLANFEIAGVEDFWAKVAQKVGSPLRADSAHKLAFYDWAMQLVAARIIYGQETSHEDPQSLPESDTAGDVEMPDLSNNYESDMKALSLAARAVDKFLAVGISKYGTQPNKLKAVTQHHTVITPSKPGPEKASKKNTTTAKDIARYIHVRKAQQASRVTTSTMTSIRLRRSPFGSHVGSYQPAWWGFINRPKVSRKMERPQRVRNEPRHDTVTAQGSSDKTGTVDELIIGMQSTAMEDATPAPQVLTNLAIRTINSLKRRRDDAEGAENCKMGDPPEMKLAKVSDENADTWGPPSQLEDP